MNSKIAMYADDTVIYYESDSIIETERMLQEDMNLILNWMNVNCLSLNASKSKTMLLMRNHNERESIINVYANNVLLEQVQNYKYLGLYLDPKLNFDFHKERLCSNSKKKLSSIC